MSFIPEGYAEIVVTYSQQGTIRPAQWTIGTDLAITEDPNTYLDGVIDSWNNAGNVLHPATFDARLSVVNVRMTVMTSTGPVIYDRPQFVTGSKTGEAQPPNVAVLIRRVTARGGRRGRGRLYLPSGYLNETDVIEGGVIIGTTVTSLQNLANNIRIGLNTVAGSVGVLLHNDGLVDPDELTDLRVQQVVATMRRRLRK